ncbi:Lipoate-protein ligase A [Halogeometricum rufum]|uniref:Lipoate-protein ligase A n=1 Tax=Halogeometricum rufum TaxID=553469 RepID=A0A1I6JC95_9EURY|nr:lipoate--protein ligase family protein [Halogeometricum rufum]SFR76140.1 Lipoate-protein ligase A [Halogeometricum rufum]
MTGERGGRVVRIVRGRAATREADRGATEAMGEETAETGVPAFRAWTPHRQVAFGRRDAHADGYETAREAAESRGFPALERSVGGRAVAYTGRTVAFASAVPVANDRTGMDDRYETATTGVVRALRSLGVPARRGEPPASFCPGDHSVQAHGKICGIAQRIRREVALVSGVVVVADHAEIAAVLEPVYEAIDVPFDPDSVGSVARGGGPADPERVARALEDAFVGDTEPRVVEVAGSTGD